MLLIKRLGVSLKSGAVIFLLSVVSCSCIGQSANSQLQSLYDEQDWPALRSALGHSKAPLFYRAAVEAAYNDVKPAVKHLDTVISEEPHSDQAYDSLGMLTNLYFRNGMYREALAEVAAMLAEKPSDEDVKAAILQLRAFSRAPDQSMVSRKTSALSMQMEQGNMHVPVAIDGYHASYILDTGANFSLMSEGEAKRIGLQISSSDSKIGDSSGVGIGMKVATARDLSIGGLHLKNVAFAIIPDSQEPFVDLPEGHRALLGIPVLLAMQAIRWESSSGVFSLVRTHRTKRLDEANISFVGMIPATQVRYQGKLLNFSLDTGAIHTDLEPHFAEIFQQLLKQDGKKGSHKVTGVGGSVSYDAITLPSLRLLVSGFDVTLQPATVLLKASSASSRWADGNLGMDLLNQAHSVTLDFKAMTLSLN